MCITDSEILSVISERRKKDAEIFFVELKTIGCEYGYEYTKRKYCGLSHKGTIVVEPIYDEVLCLSRETVALWINEKIALYSIKKSEFISQFDYVKISKDGVYWKLEKASIIISLYDCEGNRFIGDYSHSDFGTMQSHSQYFWAKRGEFYDYIKRETGKAISLPGVVMAYDTQCGMFGKDENGKILYFEESGTENPSKLRKAVCEAGGYLTLNNLKLKIEDIIDVYGNKLNI